MTVRNKRTSIPLWWILRGSQATIDIKGTEYLNFNPSTLYVYVKIDEEL